MWNSCYICAICQGKPLRLLSPPPPLKGLISPLYHTQLPTEGLNCALWLHPNWPVLCGHTSAGKPKKEEQKKQKNSSQQSPKMLKMASESFMLYSCFVVVFWSFSQNYRVRCPCTTWNCQVILPLMEDAKKRQQNVLSLSELDIVPRNSTAGGLMFICIWQNKWVGIISS